jgi:DNA polymerase III epsilon subunit family exonuclease
LESLSENQELIDPIESASDNNVVGYKILKITATEDQMASILDQLELMGVDFEEIEDGMPKTMTELTEPEFDSFVAFDIETTGSNGAANGDVEAQITEIGAVRVVNGQIVERFDELANPGRDIVPRIARLTHITNEMVADKPPVEEVIRRFYEFVGDSPLVGHNIKSSDLRYIVKAANKAGVHIEVPFLDTYLLAKKFKCQMGWEKINLPYLANFYGFEHKETHRAWSDAEVNAQVYFELQKLSRKE